MLPIHQKNNEDHPIFNIQQLSSSCPMSHSPYSPSPSPSESCKSYIPKRVPSSRDTKIKISKSPDIYFRRTPQKRMTMEFDKISHSPDSAYAETFGSVDSLLPSKNSIRNEMKTISLMTFQYCLSNSLPIEIIDCRYPYEFKAGHLKNAKLLYTDKRLFNQYPVEDRSVKNNSILLFYCEYSGGRAPDMALRLREADKHFSVNGELLYNNIYIIEGGALSLFQHLPQCCDGYYLSMNDAEYELKRQKACRKAAVLKYNFKRRNTFTLQHTFSLLTMSLNMMEEVN